jgi:twitching motility two-component system response regulator PilH
MSTILVVEDSYTQRQIVADFLVKSEFTVTTAQDGIEALEQIRQACPDLIILDIIMPHLNGFEVCRRLKSHPTTKNIPIIMCSSKCTNADRYWGLKQGADAFLGKPCHSKELIEIVKQLLSQSGNETIDQLLPIQSS